MECELCRQRATCTYKMHGKTLQLCDRCFDRYEIQTAYEKRILEIDELIRNGNYEKAFAFLQDILNVY
ncbi:MAG: hypothetical protein JRE64_16335, partial [Deltaproteobacteria bacterium]|nr:hypothetical protein [Deltaproteobacteria bacterium]